VPAILGVTLVASAVIASAACNSEECHERCYAVQYRDAGPIVDAAVVDAGVVDAIACSMVEPDPQTGECPPGCESSVCFT